MLSPTVLTFKLFFCFSQAKMPIACWLRLLKCKEYAAFLCHLFSVVFVTFRHHVDQRICWLILKIGAKLIHPLADTICGYWPIADILASVYMLSVMIAFLFYFYWKHPISVEYCFHMCSMSAFEASLRKKCVRPIRLYWTCSLPYIRISRSLMKIIVSSYDNNTYLTEHNVIVNQ